MYKKTWKTKNYWQRKNTTSQTTLPPDEGFVGFPDLGELHKLFLIFGGEPFEDGIPVDFNSCKAFSHLGLERAAGSLENEETSTPSGHGGHTADPESPPPLPSCVFWKGYDSLKFGFKQKRWRNNVISMPRSHIWCLDTSYVDCTASNILKKWILINFPANSNILDYWQTWWWHLIILSNSTSEL